MSLEEFLSLSNYSMPQAAKEARLLPEMLSLTARHYELCPAYRRVIDVFAPKWRTAQCLGALPWIPVTLFKTHELRSIPAESVTNILTSSGTTGQRVSRIALDARAADLQSRALASVIGQLLGPRRLPMIVVDSKAVISDPRLMSARGAGVLGMMKFGRNHFFALDEDMRIDSAGLRAFLSLYGSESFLLFGFTFMVWRHFFQALGDGFDLRNGILVHSGGWKKLAGEAVDNAAFKQTVAHKTGLKRVYNFYGMVEQIGSIFLEGDDGLLYPPIFGDVIVRDPETWAEVAPGQVGLIQALSLLPSSYPGHSILTEDLGVIEHQDGSSCGRLGKAFRVIGRAPQAELRGCSDVPAFAGKTV